MLGKDRETHFACFLDAHCPGAEQIVALVKETMEVDEYGITSMLIHNLANRDVSKSFAQWTPRYLGERLAPKTKALEHTGKWEVFKTNDAEAQGRSARAVYFVYEDE